VYCGATVEDGATLTLDHVRSRERGGADGAHNVVTSCLACNSAKQGVSMAGWFRLLREKGIPTDGLRTKIRRLTRTPLHLGAPAHLFHDVKKRGDQP